MRGCRRSAARGCRAIDPQGADFGPWVTHLKDGIQTLAFKAQLPREARGHVVVELTVTRDGSYSAFVQRSLTANQGCVRWPMRPLSMPARSTTYRVRSEAIKIEMVFSVNEESPNELR
jgi:hypothetical protein